MSGSEDEDEPGRSYSTANKTEDAIHDVRKSPLPQV